MTNEVFENELQLISDFNLRQQVRNLLDKVDPRHATEPASSTGKYHPDFAHGSGGLIRHTKAVVMLANELCNTRPDIDRDNVIAAAILHDMHKYDNISMHTCHEHPYLMALDAAALNLPQEVIGLIESHMGQWTKSKRSFIELPMPANDSEWLLHYADYLASRTWLKLTFDSFNNLEV